MVQIQKQNDNIVKGNTSSTIRQNMECRHCNTTDEETQEHLEIRKGTEDLRKDLGLEKEHDHMLLWRKLTRRLKDIIKCEEMKTASLEDSLT